MIERIHKWLWKVGGKLTNVNPYRQSPKAKPAKRKTNVTKKPSENGERSARPSMDSDAVLVSETWHVQPEQIVILTIFEDAAENSSTTRRISFQFAGSITVTYTTTPHGPESTDT